MEWTYNPNNYDPESDGLIPEGAYPCMIMNAEEMMTRTGKPMIRVTLRLQREQPNMLYYYIVLDDSSDDMVRFTDRKLGRLFSAFNFQQVSLTDESLQQWSGKVAVCEIRHETDKEGIKRHSVRKFTKPSASISQNFEYVPF